MVTGYPHYTIWIPPLFTMWYILFTLSYESSSSLYFIDALFLHCMACPPYCTVWIYCNIWILPYRSTSSLHPWCRCSLPAQYGLFPLLYHMDHHPHFTVWMLSPLPYGLFSYFTIAIILIQLYMDTV